MASPIAIIGMKRKPAAVSRTPSSFAAFGPDIDEARAIAGKRRAVDRYATTSIDLECKSAIGAAAMTNIARGRSDRE
jgi:hypothetical protein